MRKIREKVETEKGGKGESLMGFGKFADMTYEEVAQNHPAYAKWVLETVKEEGQASHAKLRKFVTWLNNKAAEKESGRSTAAAASTARRSDYSGYRVKRMTASEKDADAMKAEIPLMEENPIPESKVQEMMLGALEKLNTRLNTLETTQTQPEKHYSGTASGSWQNLSSDRDA